MDLTQPFHLALSGGGFRATFFHLGVIAFLRRSDYLKNIKTISAVSGGSVIAAHLKLNWQSYAGQDNDPAFSTAASKLIEFGARDVRGRITRRLPLILLRRLIPDFFRVPDYTTTSLLCDEYDRLFGRMTLDDFRKLDGPEVAFVATSVNLHKVCALGTHGFSIGHGHRDPVLKFENKPLSLPLSLAVAASSAYPVFFRPVELDAKDHIESRMTAPRDRIVLIDGGVTGNIGLGGFFHGDSSILVSDASTTLDWAPAGRRFGMVATLIEVAQILLDRVTQFESASFSGRRIRIDQVTEAPGDLPRDVQVCIRDIRTDFDKFTNDEIMALIAHGYGVARKELGEKE
jgi:predicted acylesterase/phospholipase RssA